MQHLKDEVKEAIIEAALDEFRQKGYTEASMREIAKSAGMTVGNIYRYFEGKDDLFNCIIDPVWQEVMKTIFDNYELTPDMFPMRQIITSIMDIYKKFNVQLFILINKSKGSKYENVKEGLVDLIANRLEKEFMPILHSSGKVLKDTFIFKMISNAIVDSIYIIMKECGDNIGRLESLMEQMLTVFIKDLYYRL